MPLIRASGQLPHGTLGECIYDDLIRGVERFVEKTGPYIPETALEPLELDLGIAGFRLTGRIDAIYPERLLRYRYARVKPRDRLDIWIHHLALNSAKPDKYPRTSMLAGMRPKGGESEWVAWEYSPVESSDEILARLLKQYWAGLVRPLHFFPDSS
ncbi:RecBCD enzyme subunit RecC [subsurface metagenome]